MKIAHRQFPHFVVGFSTLPALARTATAFQVYPGNRGFHSCSTECDSRNMMSLLAELDRSNVVDIDLGSAEFKANAHRHMAEWARRRPFYVLGNGPAAGGGRPLRRRASRVFRYRDFQVRDAARPRLGAVQQDHVRAVRHADGRRAACPCPPPVDAGILVAADRATPGAASPGSSTACSTASRQTAPSSTACRTTGRISSSMPCWMPW